MPYLPSLYCRVLVHCTPPFAVSLLFLLCRTHVACTSGISPYALGCSTGSPSSQFLAGHRLQRGTTSCVGHRDSKTNFCGKGPQGESHDAAGVTMDDCHCIHAAAGVKALTELLPGLSAVSTYALLDQNHLHLILLNASS